MDHPMIIECAFLNLAIETRMIDAASFALSRFLVKEEFACRINVILSVQSCAKKYFALPVGQIIFIPSRHPGPIRGAFRDRHERWAGMRWTLQARKANAREADGEVVWS